MTDITPAPDSIDSLIAGRLPRWLVDHQQPDRLRALRLALLRQQQCAEQLKQKLAGILPLHAFAAQLLVEALRREGIANPDVIHDKVRVTQQVVLPSASLVLPLPFYVHRSKRTLLEAALHNYHRSETRPAIHRKGSLTDRHGKLLHLSVERFAALCREVDVGRRYQELLKEHLEPPDRPGEVPGQAVARLNEVLRQNLRSHCEVDVRTAALKGEIDEQTYLLMLPVVAQKNQVPALEAALAPRQLYLLGRRIHGVLTLKVRSSVNQPLQAVILWIPHDPHTPVSRHASWEALGQYLGHRFLEPSYRRFFARFIAERDRNNFYRVLEERVAQAPATGVELDARERAIDAAVFEYLRQQYVHKLCDDAKVLAVPTGVEDEEERAARLQAYAELGLNLLTLAGLFVPLIGQMLMVATAVQLAGEVYEGYQDWRIGDREGAMNHLFNVAENVVIGLMIAKGSQLAMRGLERVAFVDELAPVQTAAGGVRLMDSTLPGYQAEPRVGQGANEWLWHVDDRRFRVMDEVGDGVSRLHHPSRPGACRLRVEGNGSGGWRHELECPQRWEGQGYLVRRLSARLAELPDTTCEYLLQVTGFSEAQVRRLHVEQSGVPARMLDALDLHQAHEWHPDLSAAALAEHVAALQARPHGFESLLQRAFPGLSARCRHEVLQHCTGAELDALGSQRRIPLAVAQRARWAQRESRLDRACAGLRLPRWVNADSERLAVGLLERQLAWPDDSRLELREGNPNGLLLASIGAEKSAAVQCIVRRGSGYQAPGQVTAGEYMRALLAVLSDSQLTELGDAAVSPAALGMHLADAAAEDRALAAELCGMARRGASLRPPARLGDGGLGYALSGRGGGSRRAIAQGIHQVFPTLTDDELQAYVLDLMNRRVGLWEHYGQLRDQLARLQTRLREWRREAGNPLDAMRRRRVATALRRSWRRKITDLAGDHVLVIEGERIGTLPDLPEGVRYEHVRRLVLRNLGLTEIAGDFLQRFPNLVELDLSDNRLTAIPHGIGEMSRLRHLDLQNNRIVMDEGGELRLAGLAALQRLGLSHNPLGRAPVLTRLVDLRAVELRDVGLDAFPERISFRAHVDLRDNNIRELRLQLEQLRLRVQHQALHDNPLSESSEALLDEARGISPGLRGSASARHHGFGDQVFDVWAGSTVGSELDRQLATWTALREASNSSGLFRFLADFAHSEDFEHHPGHYRSRIWRILQACEDHEQLRERLFLEANGPRTCEDRLLLLLEQLELGVRVEYAVDGARGPGIESRLLGLGRGLFRLDEVDHQASLHLQRMRAEPFRHVDDIEVRLYYRQRLARALGLPIEIDDMHYPGFANVTTSDLLRAQDLVLERESPEALISSLAQRPFWDQYAREFYAQRFEEVLQPLHRRMEALQAQVDAAVIDEHEFLKRCEALKKEFDNTERSLIERLAREAYERWGMRPPEYPAGRA
ncbi:NEL-type E3 ubiquitin ligase domain-containing protein [Pseudomonas sp. NPDC089401]|uniref:NEL-type E3 ubiquitin ligase domain-containing protein n=1 Tax=Pseudomonas sp. NPDC089401 TaxID=3364462 RepID=UPI0037F4F91E